MVKLKGLSRDNSVLFRGGYLYGISSARCAGSNKEQVEKRDPARSVKKRDDR